MPAPKIALALTALSLLLCLTSCATPIPEISTVEIAVPDRYTEHGAIPVPDEGATNDDIKALTVVLQGALGVCYGKLDAIRSLPRESAKTP